jgi:hypothetical protein
MFFLSSGKNKWYGGLLSPIDGNIYGICHNKNTVLKIDVHRQECVELGDLPEGGFKWHGGNVGADGNVYGVPCHADTVLKIDVKAQTVSTVGGPILASKKRPDGKYKYLGGVNGTDGCIYCMPADADFVCRFDPVSETTRFVGASLEHEQKNHTKWQNGFMGRDNCIYGIPHCARSVCRVDLDTQEVTAIPLPSECSQLGKWEGGVVARDGSLFCMPMSSKRVLRISPGPTRATAGSNKNNGGNWGDGRAHD